MDEVLFGMVSNPFLKSTKNREIIETSEVKEIESRLNYLKEWKGFGLITGEAGRGKTTAVRRWADKLNPSSYKVVYIPLSTLTAVEFYRELAMGLDCVPAFRKIDNFKQIQEAISRFSLEKKITPVIILDEANYINNAILNELKMIFNFQMDSRERAVVILVGLPVLNNTLNLMMHEPLKQRIVMNYHIEPLDMMEGRIYIEAKLKSVKCNEQIFNENAVQAILNASNGTPRMIDKICNRCLMIAQSKGMDRINEEIAMSGINDVQLG